MDRMEYAKNCVLARVYEKRLLDKAKIDRMVSAKDAEEVYKLLMETEYAKCTNGVSGPRDYDILLGNEIARIYEVGEELLLDYDILEMLMYKYEFHNMRVMAKELVTNKDFSELYLEYSSFDPEKCREYIKNGNNTNVPEYVIATIEKALDAYDVDHNPQAIDFSIDRSYFEMLVKTAKKIDVPMITDYVKAVVDFYNITAFIRARKHGVGNIQNYNAMLVPGGDIDIVKLKGLINGEVDKILEIVNFGFKGKYIEKGLIHYKETRSLEMLEDLQLDCLAEICSSTKFSHFGPEPIFAYLLAREKQEAIVRIILISKLNGIAEKDIRERLGEEYV